MLSTRNGLIIFISIGYVTCITIYCSKRTQIYDEMKCKPIYRQSLICPAEYNCSNVFNRPKDMCFLQGNLYSTNDTRIVSPELERTCNVGCFCSNAIENKPRLMCAIVDCRDVFEEWPEKLCRKSYSNINQCCSDQICPPFDNRTTCKYGNQTYYETERFYPEKCRTCICTKNGTVCQRNKCLVEYYNLEKIDQKCAPVYTIDSCCPIEWICYNKTDVVIPKKPVNTKSPKCMYGNIALYVADILVKTENDESGYMCSCQVPPLLTCWKY